MGHCTLTPPHNAMAIFIKPFALLSAPSSNTVTQIRCLEVVTTSGVSNSRHFGTNERCAPFSERASKVFRAFNSGRFLVNGTWEPSSEFIKMRDTAKQRGFGQVHMLAIGDSVDRMLASLVRVHGSCDSTIDRCWGGNSLKYLWPLRLPPNDSKVSNLGTTLCNGTHSRNGGWGTLASAHHFGARPRGPYHWQISNSDVIPNVDTERRLPDICEIYHQRFPQPQLITYQSSYWDLLPAGHWNIPPPSSFLDSYSMNITSNIAIVRAAFPCVAIALRTSPIGGKEPRAPCAAVGATNDVLRNISTRVGVGLVDWAYQMSGLISNRSLYLQDDIHPLNVFGVSMADALVDLSRVLSDAVG